MKRENIWALMTFTPLAIPLVLAALMTLNVAYVPVINIDTAATLVDNGAKWLPIAAFIAIGSALMYRKLFRKKLTA